jgi:phosphohistidine swiveling domain-containing protein
MSLGAPTRELLLADDPRVAREEEVGGKARNLAHLVKAGLRVPPFFVVGTGAFRTWIAPRRAAVKAALGRHDLATPAGAEAASEEVRALLLEGPLPGELEPLAAAGLERLSAQLAAAGVGPTGPGAEADFVAVRSSCVGEDSASASFAGQMDTYLFVRGAAGVADAVRRCWASGFSARALSYRTQRGLDPLDVSAGVVVQRMIPGDVSGVLFTASPTTGRRDVLVVSATWGLGEGLVSGLLAADNYSIYRPMKEAEGPLRAGVILEREVQDKEEEVVWDTARGTGTKHVPVAEPRRSAPALDDAALLDLARLGVEVEAGYGGTPQDVEWTRAGGVTWLLQARPITNLPVAPAAPLHLPVVLGGDRGAERVFDNSNIIESYSGVTSPLTYSYIRKAYSTLYQRSCEFNGVPNDEIWLAMRHYDSLVTLIGGCVYYNMESWYRLLWLFPGAEEGAQAMERMLGVRASWRSTSLAGAPRTFRQKVHQLRRMFSNYLRIDRLVEGFFANFRAHYGRWKDTAWDALSLQELWEVYHELQDRLTLNWQPPLAIDFLAMHSTKRLEKLTVDYGLDAPGGGLMNDLLCGEGGIESTEPTRMLMRMAQEVRGQPALREVLERTPDDQCLARLASDPALKAFHATVKDYLDRYGFRCMNELKLEEPTLKDQPAFLFTMIKNYLGQKELDVEALERREKEKRHGAEAIVAAKLGWWRRRKYTKWLGLARKAVKHRENMRFARTRSFGVLREVLNAIGRKFVERRVLDHWHDVYSLHMDEVLGFIDGTSVSTDLRGLAAVRKAEFERHRSAPDLPDRLVTSGAVHTNQLAPVVAAGPLTGNLLKGTPCCPGTVTNKVRVIKSPKDDLTLRGEILVAARTDPGWVPLYPSACGLLIERGSLLSHSAIVARELGLPTIVNIPDLTRRLKDGMTVTMDAAKGTVTIHDA